MIHTVHGQNKEMESDDADGKKSRSSTSWDGETNMKQNI